MSEFKQYKCTICGHIYDEAEGDPESGVEPGTLWQDIPDDWRCPECGSPKSEFELME